MITDVSKPPEYASTTLFALPMITPHKLLSIYTHIINIISDHCESTVVVSATNGHLLLLTKNSIHMYNYKCKYYFYSI